MSQYAPCNRPLLRDQLKAYADRQLPYMLRRQVRRHLGQCASCREELADMENFSRQLRSDGEAQNVPLAADLRARILASVPAGKPIAAGKRRHPLTPLRRPLYLWGAGATALVAWFALYPTLSRYNRGVSVSSSVQQIGTASAMYTQDYHASQKSALPEDMYAPSPTGTPHEAAPLLPSADESASLASKQATSSSKHVFAPSAPQVPKAQNDGYVQSGDAGNTKSMGDVTRDHGLEKKVAKWVWPQTRTLSGTYNGSVGGAHSKSVRVGGLTLAEELEPVERTVHREGDITVQVDKVEQISEQIAGIAQGTGGFIASTQLTTEENSLKSATLVLKVPVARFDSTLAAVSHLGEVKAKNISGEDLTEKMSDEQAQQNVLQDDANMILAKIKDGQGRRAQNEEQLRQLRVKVAQTKARLVLLKKLGALSTITVNLNEKPLPAPPPPPPPATGLMADVHDTMQDALHSLTQAAHMPILLLIWMIAYAPLWVMIYLGYRYMSRTRYRLR